MAEQSKSDASQTWWKNGYVWMVLGGPLAVVVASIATFFIAAGNPDQVIDVTAKAAVAPKAGTAPAEDAMVPAMVGRNHATTGGVPEKK
ncbi:MAG: nitrogen fixation protein FixH [Rhodoferax sp.]|nr:MAG: nitrogen fixation protein FixH [Rhodoferax sp.]